MDQIPHPDCLIEGRKYKIKYEVKGRKKRIVGTFTKMDIQHGSLWVWFETFLNGELAEVPIDWGPKLDIKEIPK